MFESHPGEDAKRLNNSAAVIDGSRECERATGGLGVERAKLS